MVNKDTFSSFHPVINFLYFGLVLTFSMVFNHPVCLAISIFCALYYLIYLKGGKGVRWTLLYMLLIFLVAALINPAFSHEGATILAYLPSGNPLTLESIVYGLSSATMLVSVINWFSCYNAVMTSDKFVYLFGRIIPAMSLVLSMTLRFVPRFTTQIKVISSAQKCVGRDVANGSILQRVRNGMTILSSMITWALENAIETADSMRSRGYGLPGRTAFSIYRFDKRDRTALIWLILCGSLIVVGACLGGLKWRYYPTMKGVTPDFAPVCLWLAYFALFVTPVVINKTEDHKWNALRSET